MGAVQGHALGSRNALASVVEEQDCEAAHRLLGRGGYVLQQTRHDCVGASAGDRVTLPSLPHAEHWDSELTVGRRARTLSGESVRGAIADALASTRGEAPRKVNSLG
jgi:hypothetical protein